MNIAIGQGATGATGIRPERHERHERHANFGALVSAIRRGDMDGAKTAFDALGALAPNAPGWSRKGALSKIGEAIETQDVEAARAALKEFQQGRSYRLEASVERDKSAQIGLVSGGSVSVLV